MGIFGSRAIRPRSVLVRDKHRKTQGETGSNLTRDQVTAQSGKAEIHKPEQTLSFPFLLYLYL